MSYRTITKDMLQKYVARQQAILARTPAHLYWKNGYAECLRNLLHLVDNLEDQGYPVNSDVPEKDVPEKVRRWYSWWLVG